MRTLEGRLSGIGDTLRETARDLTGVSETLSALKVVAEQDRIHSRYAGTPPACGLRGNRRNRATV